MTMMRKDETNIIAYNEEWVKRFNMDPLDYSVLVEANMQSAERQQQTAMMAPISYSAYRVPSHISMCCISGSVDLAANGSSDVSEGNNGSSGDSALGVASNIGGEPRKHGGDRSKDTAGGDGQTDIAGNGG